jgi:Zn-dependent protease with chaperone function
MSTSADKEFDFHRFVERRKRASLGGDEATRYAYSADVAMMRTFKKMRPIELAAAATVRAYKDWLRNELLGKMIKVGPKQFPSIYKIAQECAQTLNVPVPQVYIANHPTVNAYTFGTDEESFIVVHSQLVDHFTTEELKFVIGHETGHIQNKHVIYNTVLLLMTQAIGIFVKWIVMPAEVALRAWFRRAEITCDRAGLLVCKDLDVASRTFLKMACGSQKLYNELDVDEYLLQHEEGRSGIGRITEAFATHPYLPKRVLALRAFAESELYRKVAEAGEGGLSMEEVDKKTSDIIQILGDAKKEGQG